MAGRATNPIRVTPAPTIPVQAAKTVHTSIAAIANEPLTGPRARCTSPKSLSVMPERSSIHPMKTNKG
ncbi:unnamed protein product, partial [marine sediment metagenome]